MREKHLVVFSRFLRICTKFANFARKAIYTVFYNFLEQKFAILLIVLG